ncbi:MAG: glycosyltransferase family 4 protein [Proteobacteria bacterium]|nr:glycosyltransferase family 4 protein [Pseudomonadota bacterium]
MARALRILWVASKLGWSGGIGNVVARGARALAERGHEVHLAGPTADGEPGPLPGVVVHAFRKRRMKVMQLVDLVPLVRGIEPDVVHFHSAMPHGDVIAGLRWLRPWRDPSRAPLIAVTAHSSRPYAKRRARIGLRAADVVVVPSQWAAAHAQGAGARAEAIHVVPAGIDTGAQPDLGARDDAVLALGRLKAVKHLDLLIDAFASLASERPSWQLWIAGDGPERAALAERVRAAGLEDRVELLGWIAGAEKERVLCRAAIGAVPSQRESFGIALLEMQAHGLACVASDTGGLAELADHGNAARLVPPGDVAALTRELAALMDEASARQALAREGRRAAERYDWSEIARRYEVVYAEARASRS